MNNLQPCIQHPHTGVLSSRPTARDIKIDGFSLGICGNELIQDCSIELTIGRRYGLIGQNGCGKTSFLQVRCCSVLAGNS
jgi:ATP-binding cassette subfamily F protein 2